VLDFIGSVKWLVVAGCIQEVRVLVSTQHRIFLFPNKFRPATFYTYWVKLKESRNRLGVAQSVPGGLDSQIS
jgi:hypothetical protein